MPRGAVPSQADRWAISATTLFVLTFSAVGWLKYQGFAFLDFDLAHHAQTMWSLLHGALDCSILGLPFLGNHAQFILFALVPFYAIARHPVTLVVLQAAASGWGGWVLYRLARRELPAAVALAVLASYLLYPALGYANLFEFHPPVLSIPFVLLAVIALRDRRAWACAGWGLAACLCQENLPLVIAPLGLYALFLRRSWRWVVAPLVGGGLYFLLVVGWVIPALGRGTIDFLGLYRHLGQTPAAILRTVLTDPGAWRAALGQQTTGPWLLGLFGPLAGLPLLSPAAAVCLSGPSFVQHLFSARGAERTIYFHYAAELIPGVFLSTLWGMQRLLQWRPCAAHPRWMAGGLVAWAVGANLILGPQLWLPMRWVRFLPDHTARAKAQLLTQVPREAGVVATFTFLPHLAHRSHLYSFHHWWIGQYTLSTRPYVLPSDATLAVIDVNDPTLFLHTYMLPGFEDRVRWQAGFRVPDDAVRLAELVGAGSGWVPVAHLGSNVLFERPARHPVDPLYAVGSLPARPPMAVVNGALELAEVTLDVSADAGRPYEVTKAWVPRAPLPHSYLVLLQGVDAAGRPHWLSLQPPAHRLSPMTRWPAGTAVVDRWRDIVPVSATPGRYTIRLRICDEHGRPAPLVAGPRGRLTPDGWLEVGTLIVRSPTDRR